MTNLNDEVRAHEQGIDAMTDLDLLTASRQVLLDDRDELAFGQYIDQADADHDKPCHCLAGAALQACGLYRPMESNPAWLQIPAHLFPLEAKVISRLAPLLEPCFDEVLIRAAAERNTAALTDCADTDETVTWFDLLHPADCDRSGLTDGALVYTYNDHVLHHLGRASAKAEAIKLYDRAIERAQEASA